FFTLLSLAICTHQFIYIPPICIYFFYYSSFLLTPPPPRSTLFPYTTLFRSCNRCHGFLAIVAMREIYSVLCPNGKRDAIWQTIRSEEHTSELQSRFDLVCRLLLEKKKKRYKKKD